MTMNYVTEVAFGRRIVTRLSGVGSRRPKNVYKRYLRLIRILQEKGVPVKPLHYNVFKKAIEWGELACAPHDFSDWSEHIAKIDAKKAFFSAMAAHIVVAPYASRAGITMVGPAYGIKKEHVADFLTALRPEDIPRAVGEVHKRALKDEFVKEQKAPPSEIDKIPELVEDAAKVLEEYFEGDPEKAEDYLASVWTEKEPAMEELEKEYSDLLFRADKIFREWEEKRKRRALPAPPEAGKEVPVKKKAELAEVKELKPPKAVSIILTKLEAAREMAQWMGGVDIRALKKILYDVRERKKIVGEALRLVKEWERGNKEAFLEEYAHVKNLPEERLEEHKLVGDLERIRRKVAAGELTPTDAANILTALHTTYSVTESHLTDFLSRIEEHSVGREPRSLRIRPERLDKHVIKPLKEKLERIRPIIRGKF